MKFAIICLVGLSVLASPCAWDSDPHEASAIAVLIAKFTSSEAIVSENNVVANNRGPAAR